MSLVFGWGVEKFTLRVGWVEIELSGCENSLLMAWVNVS